MYLVPPGLTQPITLPFKYPDTFSLKGGSCVDPSSGKCTPTWTLLPVPQPPHLKAAACELLFETREGRAGHQRRSYSPTTCSLACRVAAAVAEAATTAVAKTSFQPYIKAPLASVPSLACRAPDADTCRSPF